MRKMLQKLIDRYKRNRKFYKEMCQSVPSDILATKHEVYSDVIEDLDDIFIETREKGHRYKERMCNSCETINEFYTDEEEVCEECGGTDFSSIARAFCVLRSKDEDYEENN